jgi:hypothetical protein
MWIGAALIAMAIGAGAAAAFIALRRPPADETASPSTEAATAPATPTPAEPARPMPSLPNARSSLTVEAPNGSDPDTNAPTAAHRASHPAHSPSTMEREAPGPAQAPLVPSAPAEAEPEPSIAVPRMLDDPWAEDVTASAGVPSGEAESSDDTSR